MLSAATFYIVILSVVILNVVRLSVVGPIQNNYPLMTVTSFSWVFHFRNDLPKIHLFLFFPKKKKIFDECPFREGTVPAQFQFRFSFLFRHLTAG
jgi:hypothetical protein